MKGKQYIGVLFVAALIGAGLGGAAIGIVPPVTKASTPTQPTQLTSTPAVTSTVKPSPTAATTTAVTSATAATTQAGAIAPSATGIATGLPGTSVTGTVQTVKGSLVTIKTEAGSLVNLTLGTTASVQINSPATLANVTVGSTITVAGSQTSDSVKATSIAIGSISGQNPLPTMTGVLPTGFPGLTSTQFLPTMTGARPTNQPGGASTQTRLPQTNAQPPAGPVQPPSSGTSGTVQAIEGNTITIMTISGITLKIVVDSSTTYQKTTRATAADITTGCSLTAAGAQQSDGTFQVNSLTINIAEVP
jgi:hypothetical protein